MILGEKMTLTDQVLESILEGNSKALLIKSNFEKAGLVVTIQGIYKALRELIAENIILKQGKNYFINNRWRDKVERLITKKNALVLSPGEEIRYKFKRIENTDAFWKNMFIDISRGIGDYPIFHFVPHQFWILLKERGQSELEYYRELNRNKIYGYTLIGGGTKFDNEAKNKLTSEYHQLHTDNKTSFNNRDHISVLNDYIIITRISGQLAEKIEDLYKKSKTEEDLTNELEKVFKKPGCIKIIIKRDNIKAQKIRKTISKDFYVSKELREKFDLFYNQK